MRNLLRLSFYLLVVIFSTTVSPSRDGRTSLPLTRRSAKRCLNEEDYGDWAELQAEAIRAKYGLDGFERRATGTAYLVNHLTDSAYYASIGIGTPPVAYNVILDTGSSDLWVAGEGCAVGCDGVDRFKTNSSTTFRALSLPFAVRYGSAAATGSLGRDVVTMAGYEVENQLFAVVNGVTPGLLSSPVSGLMGLAFPDIAASGGIPFWKHLADAGVWDNPLMSFCLTRFLDVNDATDNEPGGIFIMGGVDETLYSGDIDFVSLPIPTGTYWELPVTSLTVQGQSISLPTGSSANAAIDTGTTLIGAPAAIVNQIAAAIPGSTPGEGQYQDYFFYPCNTTVTTTIAFGGRTWEISHKDFELLHLSNGKCLSAFFRLSISGSAPEWIIGDTFLKNVYSVFRYDPPAIGFANLSAKAIAFDTVGRPLPTPSLGATVFVTAAVSSAATLSFALPSCILLFSVQVVITSSVFYY